MLPGFRLHVRLIATMFLMLSGIQESVGSVSEEEYISQKAAIEFKTKSRIDRGVRDGNMLVVVVAKSEFERVIRALNNTVDAKAITAWGETALVSYGTTELELRNYMVANDIGVLAESKGMQSAGLVMLRMRTLMSLNRLSEATDYFNTLPKTTDSVPCRECARMLYFGYSGVNDTDKAVKYINLCFSCDVKLLTSSPEKCTDPKWYASQFRKVSLPPSGLVARVKEVSDISRDESINIDSRLKSFQYSWIVSSGVIANRSSFVSSWCDLISEKSSTDSDIWKEIGCLTQGVASVSPVPDGDKTILLCLTNLRRLAESLKSADDVGKDCALLSLDAVISKFSKAPDHTPLLN